MTTILRFHCTTNEATSQKQHTYTHLHKGLFLHKLLNEFIFLFELALQCITLSLVECYIIPCVQDMQLEKMRAIQTHNKNTPDAVIHNL